MQAALKELRQKEKKLLADLSQAENRVRYLQEDLSYLRTHQLCPLVKDLDEDDEKQSTNR